MSGGVNMILADKIIHLRKKWLFCSAFYGNIFIGNFSY